MTRFVYSGEVPSPVAHYYVHMFTTTLAWTHSCVNPILYAFMREDLRIKVTWHHL